MNQYNGLPRHAWCATSQDSHTHSPPRIVAHVRTSRQNLHGESQYGQVSTSVA